MIAAQSKLKPPEAGALAVLDRVVAEPLPRGSFPPRPERELPVAELSDVCRTGTGGASAS
eukprot:CAMPEP_0119426244 /NCGR_PEP_ID=MMETSP1335-20130426/35996_1 /TAXON_ID=259385 /ORGANISM="Chrysoculter rhomboideus, Strain RCC1486" /LENGTH=59 /DNA_ID=CAMNT_0007451827 /DNA_START=53 /DNA_END=229 /DNA_ORIENTATION=+